MEYFGTSKERMILILDYFNPIYTADNLTLSVGKVVIDFNVADAGARDRIMIHLRNLSGAEVRKWNGFRRGQFHEQYSVQLEDGVSFWVGIGLRAAQVRWKWCRIEFNPNKVAKYEEFQDIMSMLIANTRFADRTIKRYDLAVGIPVCRDKCFLVKDNRIHSERRHGQEWTEYLGAKSSAVGRVKLYNKQVESKLPRPLTRLELTLNPATPYEKVKFPTVYYIDDMQMVFDEIKATDTQRFILNAILQGYGSLNDLGRKMREAIKNLMSKYVHRIEISQQDFNAVQTQLFSFLNGTYRVS